MKLYEDFSFVENVFHSNFIYFVTCERLSLGCSDEEVVDFALRAGVRVVQLREKIGEASGEDYEKDKQVKAFLEKAKKIRELTARYRSVFIVNDYVELALRVGADGVHLGQEDMPLSRARSMAEREGRKLFLGQSTHNEDEIEKAKKDGADYINIGPLFPTQTKENAVEPIVKSDYSYLVKLVGLAKKLGLTFTVMGGIKQRHLKSLFEIGCRHVAMVSEICAQKDVTRHVTSMVEEMKLLSKKKMNTE